MKKARDIQRERMWPARKTELERLDIDMEYQRADERRDNAAKWRIALEKQALRDVTDDLAIEAARTPEQFKRVWPKNLPETSPVSL